MAKAFWQAFRSWLAQKTSAGFGGNSRIIDDSELGAFSQTGDNTSLNCEWLLGVNKITVSLEPDLDKIYQPALENARLVFSKLEELVGNAAQYAADKMLVLKNETWLEEDEAQLSAEQFVSILVITAIDIDGEGNVNFWFDDGESSTQSGLFWGHTINVSMQGGEFTDADLMG